MGIVAVTMGRRELLQATAVAWFAEQALGPDRRIEGQLVGASHRVGHLLRGSGASPRKGAMTSPPTESAEVVIVGAGASGLSAAWRLGAAGVPTRLLDLESFIGGTSTWGEDPSSGRRHPWGAHYLPVPEPGARGALRLLSDLDVLTGWDAAGRPRFRDDVLCHAPEERVFFRGAWFEGLVPRPALTASERREVDRFVGVVEALSARRGRDGRPAFTLPGALSSTDPEFLALDRMSMAAWLDREGFVTPMLRWLVNYATLDDFGAELDQCSAWAGLLYFAARAFDSDQLRGSRYLVWPEGNGYLMRGLARLGAPTVSTGALVVSLAETKHGVTLHYLDVATATRRRIDARAAVLAVPGFIVSRIFAGPAPRLHRTTSSWLVANLHLRRRPDTRQAWDSILHGSNGLGYVDADHQALRDDDRTTWTYFRAFGGPDPRATRRRLLDQRWAGHASDVLADLAPAHPELVGELDRIDVMVWGHAMPRPEPGFLSAGGAATPWSHPTLLSPRVAWAHVDLTGFALFEEANAHGIRAAEAICDAIDVDRGASWA
ncbi:MAG: NAD(P)-binding protein [Myxococcota bacterium]